MPSVLYVFGGDRMERVTDALDGEFEVVYQQEVVGEPWWTALPVVKLLPLLLVTNAFLRRERPIVFADRFLFRRLVLLALCRRHGCPYVARTRGSMWAEFRDRHSDTHPVLARLKSTVDEFLRDVVLRRADRIQAVSFFNRMQIVYELPVDPGRIDVVYESCDIAAFDGAPRNAFKREAGVPEDGKVLLTVTNFDYRQKIAGVEYFFPAVETFLREHPEWHYVVAGDGTHRGAFAGRLRGECDEGLRERVSFVGYRTPIETLFADADVVFHPSFRDALPNAVIEGLVARKPVLVNADGGMAEALPDEYLGLQLVNERGEFIESARRLAADPALRRRVGERNRAVGERRFRREAVREMFERSVAKLDCPAPRGDA